MKFFVTVAIFAASMANASEAAQNSALDKMTVDGAASICGQDLTLHCCNKYDGSQHYENYKPNLLGGILGNFLGNNGLHLFDQCSRLSVSGIPGGGDILNSHCRAKAACCDHFGGFVSGGLLNAVWPCLAIDSLVG